MSSTVLLKQDEIPEHPASTSRFGYNSLASEATSFVTKPVQELQHNVKEVISIRMFWMDMERRERTIYHQMTVVLGIVQLLLAIAYCAMLEFAHNSDTAERSIDLRFLNFIVMEVAIASIAQTLYSVRGICLENSPMLLIANVNAAFLAVRVGLTVMMDLQPRATDATFTALYALIAALHVACSYTAWGGDFSRFMSFCIGTDEHIQRMFRDYQLLSSVGVLDLQLCVMTAGALLFFIDAHWWHYVLVSMAMFVNIALHSLVRRCIREEKLTQLWVVIPYDIAYCIFMIVALYDTDVLGSDVAKECFKSATFTVVVFVVVRLAFFVSLWRCKNNFGNGMVDAFRNQKTSTEFLLQATRKYRPMFLSSDSPLKPVV